jgi:hypothetical protein
MYTIEIIYGDIFEEYISFLSNFLFVECKTIFVRHQQVH